jgi:osmotically-inducible protein OsmY
MIERIQSLTKGPLLMQKPNLLLESDVRTELDTDLLLDDTRVEVSAKDGTVTLTGAVPTYYDFVRATEDTQRVGGVRAVDNQLVVGLVGEAIADADVAAACLTAMDADRFVPKGAVTVDVVNGWVTLTGHVRHHYQRQAAEHAVWKVDGVRGITDKVEITGDPMPGDVVERINKSLERNAIVDDSLITVSNEGHTIYLDGTTTSWAARSEAEDAAWAAPGVSDVVDRITIVP